MIETIEIHYFLNNIFDTACFEEVDIIYLLFLEISAPVCQSQDS